MSAATARNGRGPRVPLLNTPAPEPARAQTARDEGVTPALDGAVLAVQAAAPKLLRNASGQIGSRTYGYVTLDAIMEDVLPLLVEHELLWRTFPTVDERGALALRYRMTHVPSGECDEDMMALQCAGADPQAQGSAITYARRYALSAYLSLTVDPDDDGTAAARVQHRADSTEVQEPQAQPQKRERRITANQRAKLLEPRALSAGLDAGQFANVILIAAGEPPREWRDIEHARETKDRLLEHLPARLKDAVLQGIDAAAAARVPDFRPCVDCGAAMPPFASRARCPACTETESERIGAEWMTPLASERQTEASDA